MATAPTQSNGYPMIFRPLDAGRLQLANRLMAPPHASAISDLFGTEEQAESHLGYWRPRVAAGLGWVDGITGYVSNNVPPGFDPTGQRAAADSRRRLYRQGRLPGRGLLSQGEDQGLRSR